MEEPSLANDPCTSLGALHAADEDHASSGYNSPASSALSPASSARSGPSEGGSDGGGSSREDVENFTYWPFGFQLKAVYDHGKKNAEIMGVSYNGRMRQFVVLDSKGITTWSKDAIEHAVQRAMTYPKYEYRLITYLTYARKYTVYFVLSKDFSVKVLNRDFDETCRVSADLRSVLFMLFNPVRDELITGGVGGTKVWRYHQVPNKTWKEIRPMANYKLTLKYELKNVGGSWVKKVELDLVQQHLYCCSDTDLQAYDMDGNSLFRFDRAHSMSITGCAYSTPARHLVTASADREVKVWSITGGLVHTFRGHSQAITDLILHPEIKSLVLTSSLDGTIRMWSLDMLEPCYSLVVSTEGVRWMGLTDDNLLYVSTSRNLSVWSLNTTVTFWSLARGRLTSLRLVPGHGKSSRVVAVGEDSSVRILSRATRQSVSMVMPPPPISPLSRFRGVTHVRDVNATYVLIDSRHLWLYTNRSDPACRMAVWDLLDIQAKLLSAVNTKGAQNKDDNDQRPSSAMFGARGGSHRATLEGHGNEGVAECRCICYLHSPAAVWTDEGKCCPIQHQYLLLGLEDGRILFMDPLIKGKRYMEFRANKDAISEMSHDERHSCLVTRCDLGDACLLQFWDLPSLGLRYELYAPPDVTCYARLDDNFLTGHQSGAILHHKLIPVVDGTSNNKPKSLREGIAAIFANSEKTGHRVAVTSLDVCYTLRLFLSASPDGLLKIWDETKSQVSEVQLDESLTSACFLNAFGDVVVAFKNHIFFIDRAQVSSESNPAECLSEEEGEESDQFEDTSMLTELGESTEPIDMRSYLVPYKAALAKEFGSGGKYEGVDTPADIKEIADEEEAKLISAPSEIYDSPRSTPRDLALIDLTLSAAVTAYDLGEEDADTEGAPPAQEKKKRMTPKERRRALKKQKKFRTVQFDAPKYDRTLGVEIPQFGGSPCSTPPSSPSSLGGSASGCSWLSYSTGGRSTPDDLSWDSDDYSDNSEEEVDEKGAPTASPRRERKSKPKPSSTEKESEVKGEGKPRGEEHRVRRKKFSENIRVDAQQLIKEEEMKKRAERKRQRRQADQAVTKGDTVEEEQVVAQAQVVEPQPAPPSRKIREVKKKEKRAARRVGQHQIETPNADTTTEETPSEQEKKPIEDEQEKLKREQQEKLQQQREAEEKKKLLEAEEEKRREEQKRKEKVEEERREAERKRKEELAKEKEAEEKKKQAALELLERDKRERERLEELKKTKSQREQRKDAALRPPSPDKQTTKKRAPSAKPKSAKSRPTTSVGRRRHKPGSGKKKESASETSVRVDADQGNKGMQPVRDETVTVSESDPQKPQLQVDLPRVEVEAPTLEKTPTVETGSQVEQTDGVMPPSVTHHDVQSWLATTTTDDEVDPLAESIAESRGLFGDSRDTPLESRSRSPGAGSDAGSEMTVPHVDIPITQERSDDDWWWRKSRRRRSMTSASRTPAEGARQRPHTAQVVISNLTQEELESTYQELLHRYQGVPGTPDFVEKLHKNEGTKFEDNWHDRAIERHMLLKMQRHLRAQSANNKARRVYHEQQERRRGKVEKKNRDSHSSYGDPGFQSYYTHRSQNAPTPSDPVRPVISVTRASSVLSGHAPPGPPPGGSHALSAGRAHSVIGVPSGAGGRRSRGSSAVPSVKSRPATAAGRMQLTPAPSESGRSDKAELSAEHPFRCRLTPSSILSSARSRSQTVTKEEIDIRLLDPRNPASGQYRPRTGASVPSKCSRYVLIEGARGLPGEGKVMPTVLEQRLITERFPEHHDEWLGHVRPPPKFRPPLLLYHPPAFTQYATTS